MNQTREGRKTIRLVIPRRPPSQNDFTRSSRSHWAYMSIRKMWEQEIAAVVKPEMRSTGPRSLCVVRVYGGRERPFDWCNGVGGLKPLVDALVSQGLLEDDDLAHLVKVDYEQVRSFGPDIPPPATIIEITDFST